MASDISAHGYLKILTKSELPMTKHSTHSTPYLDKTLTQLLTPLSGDQEPGARRPLPSWAATISMLEDLREVLLMNPDPVDAEQRLARAVHTLDSQIKVSLLGDDSTKRPSFSIENFLSKLPQIRNNLVEDTETALRSDPAVRSREEIIICYPGLRALTYYRIAHVLYKLEVPLLPRLITEIGHSVTGIDIHPGAKLGKRFFIDHGTGVVIGATCIIGDDVKIYQGVTLGARSFPKSGEGQIIKGLDRHPIIGDRVTIYAGATILGRVNIGSDSVIGGNVWITKDVPAKSNVMQHRPKQEKFIHGAGI